MDMLLITALKKLNKTCMGNFAFAKAETNHLESKKTRKVSINFSG